VARNPVHEFALLFFAIANPAIYSDLYKANFQQILKGVRTSSPNGTEQRHEYHAFSLFKNYSDQVWVRLLTGPPVIGTVPLSSKDRMSGYESDATEQSEGSRKATEEGARDEAPTKVAGEALARAATVLRAEALTSRSKERCSDEVPFDSGSGNFNLHG
jgi:hypothetical protein